MSKRIKGEKIDKVIRIDDRTLDVKLKDGNIIRFKSVMCDYDDCTLTSKAIYKNDNYY